MGNQLKKPKLLPRQWKLMATAISNISQAVILYSLAAIFTPEVIGLSKDFSREQGIIYLISGLLILITSIIIMRKGAS